MQNFQSYLQSCQTRVDKVLVHALSQYPDSSLRQAMEYALLLGGKRLRPFLVYATGEMLNASLKQLDAAAAAIEAIHAYSLIHDDLPAMDDDELRRGHKTCHLVFDEATAILAGDALQSLAFSLLADCTSLDATQKIALVKVLADNAGAKGMCLGQNLDLSAENKIISLQDLERIHQYKTGALLETAVKMGVFCSVHWKNKHLTQNLEVFAQKIGLAYQVQDDILDIEGDELILGKTVGADIAQQKSTYPKLLGVVGAKVKAQQLHQEALNALDSLEQTTEFDPKVLRQLASFVVARQA